MHLTSRPVDDLEQTEVERRQHVPVDLAIGTRQQLAKFPATGAITEQLSLAFVEAEYRL